MHMDCCCSLLFIHPIPELVDIMVWGRLQLQDIRRYTIYIYTIIPIPVNPNHPPPPHYEISKGFPIIRYISRAICNCHSHHPISSCSVHDINIEWSLEVPQIIQKSIKIILHLINHVFGDSYVTYPS